MTTRATFKVAFLFFLLGGSTLGQVVLNEIHETQRLRRAEGIIHDQYDSPMPEVEVQLRAPGSDKVLKSTWSRVDGHFWFVRVPPGNYDLYFHENGWNPMLYHVTIGKNGSKGLLMVKMQIAN